MIKRATFILLGVFFAVLSKGQSVGTYTYHHKNYFVYPVRIENEDELPQAGFRIPDGDYVVFHNYVFKRKGLFKKHVVLYDTAKVVGYAQVRNNQLNGPASLYFYNNNNHLSLKKHPYKVASGNYKDGQKDSTWRTKNLENGWYELTDYKNDLLNGYDRSYNAKNQLTEKFRYKDQEKTDTAFIYFSNGRLMKSYDFYPEKEQEVLLFDMYSMALKDYTSIMTDGAPKTFYREYNKDGRLLLDLKFKDGKPLPFDSARTSDKFLRVTRLGSAGKEEQFKIACTRQTVMGSSTSEDLYTGFTLLKHIHKEYRKKTNDTIYQVKEILPLDTTLDRAVPQVVVRNFIYGDHYQTVFIPKYGFSFERSQGKGLLATDARGPAFVISDTSETLPGGASVVSQVTCIPVDSLVRHDNAYNPYTNKLFMASEEMPDKTTTGEHDNGSDYFYHHRKDYSEINPSKTYFKSGKPFSGRAFIMPSHLRHYQKDSLLEIDDNDYSIIEKGTITNGKREGTWQQLVSDELSRVRRSDMKGYFLKHPNMVDSYAETGYKNGLKNGHQETFVGELVKDLADDFGSTPTEKQALAELLKKNLSTSKKQFVYRSEECGFANDTLDGPYKSYFSNNKPEKVMFFKKGRPHGDYRRYAYTGELLAEGNFNEGRFEGNFYRYYGNYMEALGVSKNLLEMKAVFKNNRLVDTLMYYSIEGHLSMAFKLNNDTVVFKKQYFGDGRLMEDLRFERSSTFTINEEILESSNYIDIVNSSGNDDFRKIDAGYTSYYDNGQVLAEGRIEMGYPAGDWKFYNINGMLVHQVNFVDTFIVLPGDTGKKEISGLYTGYYSNGKLRCKGYLKDLELSYDCFTRQDKPALDFYVLDFYDFSGRQTISNGNGFLVKYDENGLKMSSGKLVNCVEDSVWKYFTPEQKLTETGTYVKGEKNGIWYEGDLEGINFEDGACFNPNDEYEMKSYERKRKELRITKTYYINGSVQKRSTFDSNMNKSWNQHIRITHGEW